MEPLQSQPSSPAQPPPQPHPHPHQQHIKNIAAAQQKRDQLNKQLQLQQQQQQQQQNVSTITINQASQGSMGQTASPITVSNVNIKDLPTSGNATPNTKLISTMPIISTPTTSNTTTTTTTVLTRTPSSGSSTPSAQASSTTQGASSIQQQLPATMIVTTNTGTNQYQIQQAGQQFQNQPTSINLGTTKPNTSILIRQTPSASASSTGSGANTTGPSTVEALIKHQQMNKPQIHQIQVQQKTAQQQQQQQQAQTLTTSSSQEMNTQQQYQTQTSAMSAPTITKLIGGTGQPQTANPIITLTPANTTGSASSNVAANASNTAAGSTQSGQSSTPITLSAQNPTFATLIKPINLPLSTQQKQGMLILMNFFIFFNIIPKHVCV